MSSIIEELQNRRKELIDQLNNLGDFRRGMISVNYRKCGKKECWCAKEGAQGHGPQYLWNVRIKGKSVGKNLQLGPEVQKYLREIEGFKKFRSICEEIVTVNEQLCDARLPEQPEGEKELEALKKKLQRQLLKKRIKK